MGALKDAKAGAPKLPVSSPPCIDSADAMRKRLSAKSARRAGKPPPAPRRLARHWEKSRPSRVRDSGKAFASATSVESVATSRTTSQGHGLTTNARSAVTPTPQEDRGGLPGPERQGVPLPSPRVRGGPHRENNHNSSRRGPPNSPRTYL
eukprot:scaffold82030_cov20-Tisochrysis_lutea.AAC.1